MVDTERLAERLRGGERRALAQAITLVESSRADHQRAAEDLLTRLMPATGQALRLGISGVPGVGKSTFIEAFGLYLLEQGRRVAVLSIDPSSSVSGGSILGDKTRMEQLARAANAFIRPSPAGRTLGGVARRTRETLLLVEAAGFDTVLVETVGVGQSETAVANMTDMFLLLLLPGGGDELQGIKRGIMELADVIVVNKADGELTQAADRAASDYRNALRLLQPRFKHWRPEVTLCSALQGRGIAEVWDSVQRYFDTLNNHDVLTSRRAAQAKTWLWDEAAAGLLAALKQDPAVSERLPALEDKVARQQLPAPKAARALIEQFLGNH